MANQRRRQSFQPWVLKPVPPGMNCKPWYSDRLPSKCFPKHKKKSMKFPTSLDGRRWVFVKEGLDDFRRGCPPCDGMITRGTKEAFLPTISHPAPRASHRKPLKDASLFSTLSKAQQERRAFVKDIEASLTKHPLALYPSLEENISSDLLLKVLELLDPDKKMEDTWAYCQGLEKERKDPTKICKQPRTKIYMESPRIPESLRDQLSHKPRRLRKDLLDVLKRRFIPKGVHDFCEWVNTFGDLGIDENFIMQQFDIGCECKPTYKDSCIKKVNMVPLELRHCRKLSKVKALRFSIQETNFERKLRQPQDPYKSKWVKIRYGAWYLKPYLWKKLRENEPLIDPRIFLEEVHPPDIIEELYGTIAFKDFIISKGYNMPSILEKLFIRKGWDYDYVNTPIPRVVKAHAIIDDEDDYDDDDDHDDDDENDN
jgi:hypothetical protein